jgi:3-isopropylmalate/(R)-2-methylmalate dehydratase large subunit
MLIASKARCAGVTAKDIALAIIGSIGTAGGTGYAIEVRRHAVRAMSMEGADDPVQHGDRSRRALGHGRVDDTTIDYLTGRPSRRRRQWDRRVAYWRTLTSDERAVRPRRRHRVRRSRRR